MTFDRLTHAVGFALCVAFFVTWEPVLGLLAFVVLILIAPWPDEITGGAPGRRGRRRTRRAAGAPPAAGGTADGAPEPRKPR